MKLDVPLPDTLPVMVVRGATLFPETLFPLRIFEPRFRKMLAHALETDRLFALAMPEDSDEKRIRPVATVGLIRACVTSADGTSNLILHGLQRVFFEEWPQQTPFRIAKIRPYGRVLQEPEEGRLQRRAQLLQAIEDCGLEFPEAIASQIDRVQDPDRLVDLTAATFLSSASQRQTILEEEDPLHRQRRLIELLLATR